MLLGFLPIMLNFNNERFSMAVSACRMSRCCLEDAIRLVLFRAGPGGGLEELRPLTFRAGFRV